MLILWMAVKSISHHTETMVETVVCWYLRGNIPRYQRHQRGMGTFGAIIFCGWRQLTAFGMKSVGEGWDSGYGSLLGHYNLGLQVLMLESCVLACVSCWVWLTLFKTLFIDIYGLCGSFCSFMLGKRAPNLAREKGNSQEAHCKLTGPPEIILTKRFV